MSARTLYQQNLRALQNMGFDTGVHGQWLRSRLTHSAMENGHLTWRLEAHGRVYVTLESVCDALVMQFPELTHPGWKSQAGQRILSFFMCDYRNGPRLPHLIHRPRHRHRTRTRARMEKRVGARRAIPDLPPAVVAKVRTLAELPPAVMAKLQDRFLEVVAETFGFSADPRALPDLELVDEFRQDKMSAESLRAEIAEEQEAVRLDNSGHRVRTPWCRETLVQIFFNQTSREHRQMRAADARSLLRNWPDVPPEIVESVRRATDEMLVGWMGTALSDFRFLGWVEFPTGRRHITTTPRFWDEAPYHYAKGSLSEFLRKAHTRATSQYHKKAE